MNKFSLLMMSGFVLSGLSGFGAMSAFGEVMYPAEVDGKSLADLPLTTERAFESYSCIRLKRLAGTSARSSEAGTVEAMVNFCHLEILQYEKDKQKEIADKEREKEEESQRVQEQADQKESARIAKISAAQKKAKADKDRLEQEAKEQESARIAEEQAAQEKVAEEAKAQKERDEINSRVPKVYSIEWDKRNIDATIDDLQKGGLTFDQVKNKYQIAQYSQYEVSQVTKDAVVFYCYYYAGSYGARVIDKHRLPLMLQRSSDFTALEGQNLALISAYYEIIGFDEYETVDGGTKQYILIERRSLKSEK